MSAINSITFNAGSTGVAGTYAQGDPVVATVDYTPDAPSVNAETMTLTANVTNSSGAVTATTTSSFVVNTPVAGGDTVSVSDTGSHTWVEGTPVSDGSGGEDVTFSTTA
jgi:hypothetical protein